MHAPPSSRLIAVTRLIALCCFMVVFCALLWILVASISVSLADAQEPALPSTLVLSTDAVDGENIEGAVVAVTASLDQPATTDVIVTLVPAVGSSAGVGDYVLPAPLTITTGSTSASGDIRFLDDNIVEGSEVLFIAALLDGLEVIPAKVAILDRDEPGINILRYGSDISDENTSLTVYAGSENVYGVTLISRPVADVVVTPRSSDPAEVRVSGALTFSPADWNVAQTVTVASDTRRTATVSHVVSSSHQPYNTASIVSFGAGGDTICVVEADNNVSCWGDSEYGQDNPPAGRYTTVAVGVNHSCAIRTDQRVICWGANNFGNLDVPNAKFVAVSSGYDHNCGIKTDQTVTCWGWNYRRQSNPPQGTFKAVSAGVENSCGIKTDGTLVCWGLNGYGGQNYPTQGTYRTVSTVLTHGCAIKTDYTLTCWGSHPKGPIITPLGAFISVDVGPNINCAITLEGKRSCWSHDPDISTTVATTISGGRSATDVGREHACSLTNGKTLTCWRRYRVPFTHATNAPAIRINREPTKIAISGRQTTEGDTEPESFLAALNEPATTPIAVTLTVVDESTADVGDYTLPTTINFAAGEHHKRFKLLITDDNIAEPTETVLFTATSDQVFVEPATITITINDNETAGISTSTNALQIMPDETTSYTIVLDSQPTDDVTVTPTSSNPTETTTNGPITFTPTNWNIPQTITVTTNTTKTTTITHTTTSDDPNYNEYEPTDNADTSTVTINAEPTSFTVTTDAVWVSLIPGKITDYSQEDPHILAVRHLSVSEGGKPLLVTVTLDHSAPNDVVVNLAAGAGSTASSVDYSAPATLTISAGTRSVTGEVTIADDDIADQGETLVMKASIDGFDTVTAPSVTILDDDTAGIVISESSLTVANATTSTYTVKLNSQPLETVTVTPASNDLTEVSVSGSLTFTTDAWNTEQTVTVTSNAGGAAKITHSSKSADPRYNLAAIQSVDGGGYHACALRIDKTVTCWGWNRHGQSDAPEGHFKSISVGRHHSCGIKTDDTITCWGLNTDGQNNAPEGSFESVSTGVDLSCAIRADHTATCWGASKGDQLSIPAGSFLSLDIGSQYSCGLKIDNTITCWGRDFAGDVDVYYSPNDTFKTVTTATRPSCGIKTDDTVTCWLPGSTERPELSDVSLAGFGHFRSVNAGYNLVCGVRLDDSIACHGQRIQDWHFGVPDGDFRSVSVGRDFACGVRFDDSVVCWGWNRSWQIDLPGNVPSVVVNGWVVEPAGVTVSELSGVLSSGSSVSYSVVLDTQPAAPVVVTPASSAPHIAAVTGPVTFTSTNWEIPKTVTVIAQSSGTALLSHVVVSDDEYYGSSLWVASLPVTVNPVPVELELKPTTLTIKTDAPNNIPTESVGSITVTAMLDQPALSPVLVSLVSVEEKARGDFSTRAASNEYVLPGVFTIPVGSTTGSGVLSIVDDHIVETHETILLSATVENLRVVPLMLRIADDDTEGITVSDSTLTVEAGSTATYTVSLNSDVLNILDITPSASDPQIVAVPETFRLRGWAGTTHSITITAKKAGTAIISHTANMPVTRSHKYHRIPINTVTVTVTEPSNPDPIRQPDPNPIRQPDPNPIRQPDPNPVRQPDPNPVRQPNVNTETDRPPTQTPDTKPEPEDLIDTYDTNADKEIDLNELLTAMQQYRKNQLSLPQILTLIRHYLAN